LPNDLNQQVQSIATNCADYMNRLLNQLGLKYTAETFGDLFDRVGTNHISIDHNEFVRVGEPTAAGLAEDHPRRIFINTGVTAIARVTILHGKKPGVRPAICDLNFDSLHQSLLLASVSTWEEWIRLLSSDGCKYQL